MSASSQASTHIVLEACPLCAGTSSVPLVHAQGFEWVRCACAAVYKRSEPAVPAPEREAIGHEDDSRIGGDEAYFARYARRRRRRVAKSRRQIRDALEVAPPGALLDVGCSLGYTLEAARSLGVDACGVDVSSHAIAECRRAGLDARRGTLTELPFEDASFAVAVLKHVFEHTPAPRAALAELGRVLVPGGAVFLAVPNACYFKAARSPATSRFFRGEAARSHYVYYSPATLAGLLEREGFRVCSTHPRLLHRRAPIVKRLAELLVLPVRVPLRALADALGLRKEFWLVAVRK